MPNTAFTIMHLFCGIKYDQCNIEGRICVTHTRFYNNHIYGYGIDFLSLFDISSLLQNTIIWVTLHSPLRAGRQNSLSLQCDVLHRYIQFTASKWGGNLSTSCTTQYRSHTAGQLQDCALCSAGHCYSWSRSHLTPVPVPCRCQTSHCIETAFCQTF